MEKLDSYKIDLKGMAEGVVTRSLCADDAFFAAVQGPEIQHGNVAVEVAIKETAGAFRLSFNFQGEVQVMCDRCLEPMIQPVEGEAELRIKLGDTYEDDGEFIVVPENEGVLDFSWQVYEQIALQIPLRHVHADGECKEDMQDVLTKLEAHDVEREDEVGEKNRQKTDAPTDPRWDALKKLMQSPPES